jgi:hypothetical protein
MLITLKDNMLINKPLDTIFLPKQHPEENTNCKEIILKIVEYN